MRRRIRQRAGRLPVLTYLNPLDREALRPEPKLLPEELLPLSDWRTVVRVLLSRLPKPDEPRLEPKLLLSRREPEPNPLTSRLEPEATPLMLRRMALLSRREPKPELLFFCST